MELVYLWVENYKNIKNQGFNFSPRFDCEFKAKYVKDDNGDEKLEDGCELVINEKEHLENFFGENINITAIVGENGSGKSGLLESLMDVFSENSSSWMDEEEYRKYIVIYKYNNQYIYLQKHIQSGIQIIDKNGKKIEWIEKNPNQRLFEWHSELLCLIIQNEVNYNRIFKEDKQIFVEQVQLRDKNSIKKKIIINSLIDTIFKKEANKFFSPKNVSIKIRWENLFNEKEDADKYEFEVLSEIESKVIEAKQNFKDKKYQQTFLNIIDICDIKINKLRESGSLGFYDFVHGQSDFKESNLINATRVYNCLSSIVLNQPIQNVHRSTIEKLDSFDNLTIKVDQLSKDILDFIFDLPEFVFDIELKDNDKSFEDLSFGERQLLTQLNFYSSMQIRSSIFNMKESIFLKMKLEMSMKLML